MFPDVSAFSITLEWDTFRVVPDDIIVEMKAEDEMQFTPVARLKGKITQVDQDWLLEVVSQDNFRTELYVNYVL